MRFASLKDRFILVLMASSLASLVIAGLACLLLSCTFAAGERSVLFLMVLVLFAVALSLAVAYGLAVLLHAQFKKSIFGLVDTARFICEEKDFKARARKYSSDEIGLLTDTINTMLDEIARREDEMRLLNEELESRVESRTAALQQINAQLWAEKKRADQASSVKSDFLANMSHEIRTPMNGIVAACDLALEEKLPVKVANYLKIVQDSSHSLLLIINDILDFSRLEAGTMVLDHTLFPLPGLLSELNDFFAVKAHDEHIDFVIDMAPDVPVLLIGDRGRFRQILYNLVDNGIKFTHEGIVSLHVSCLDLDEELVTLEIRVRDTGVGLSPGSMERIFSSFHQEDSSSTREFGGTGLGLPISRKLARMMGGDVTVESELGQGATFFVTLKLGWKATENGDAVSPLLPIAAWDDDRGLSLRGLHVLVAEDNETNRSVAEAMLTGLGMSVDSVENGQEAVAKAACVVYDLIFMDMQMPVMDGYQAMGNIRQQGASVNSPIIAMTAHALADDREKCLAAGADGYISKPVHKKRLEEVVRRLLMARAGAGDAAVILPAAVSTGGDTCLIDVQKAIRQLGIREDVYHRVLKTFCRDYQGFRADYQECVRDTDIGKLQKMVHSLKGSSATIGADTLSGLALEADRICKNREIPDPALADRLMACLEEVLVFANKMEETGGEAVGEEGECIVKNRDELLPQLQDLADSLDQSMYDAINVCLERLEQNVSCKKMVSLSKMIRMYSYEDALTLVHAIAEEFGLSIKR